MTAYLERPSNTYGGANGISDFLNGLDGEAVKIANFLYKKSRSERNIKLIISTIKKFGPDCFRIYQQLLDDMTDRNITECIKKIVLLTKIQKFKNKIERDALIGLFDGFGSNFIEEQIDAVNAIHLFPDNLIEKAHTMLLEGRKEIDSIGKMVLQNIQSRRDQTNDSTILDGLDVAQNKILDRYHKKEKKKLFASNVIPILIRLLSPQHQSQFLAIYHENLGSVWQNNNMQAVSAVLNAYRGIQANARLRDRIG